MEDITECDPQCNFVGDILLLALTCHLEEIVIYKQAVTVRSFDKCNSFKSYLSGRTPR